jgi:hypothetical protein
VLVLVRGIQMDAHDLDVESGHRPDGLTAAR